MLSFLVRHSVPNSSVIQQNNCTCVFPVDKIKSDSLNGTGSTGDVSETSFEDGQLTELDNLIKNSDSDGKVLKDVDNAFPLL